MAAETTKRPLYTHQLRPTGGILPPLREVSEVPSQGHHETHGVRLPAPSSRVARYDQFERVLRRETEGRNQY